MAARFSRDKIRDGRSLLSRQKKRRGPLLTHGMRQKTHLMRDRRGERDSGAFAEIGKDRVGRRQRGGGGFSCEIGGDGRCISREIGDGRCISLEIGDGRCIS